MDRDRNPSGGGSGLSLQTLLISSAAAAVAATVVPLFWQQGTLFATAMTPIIVALVSEGLRRPAERIKTVAPRVTRRTATGAAVRRFEPDAARTPRPERVGARGEGPERYEPPPHLRDDEPPGADPFGLRTPGRRRPRLKIALITGLLAFLVAAAVVTASELAIFGGSVGSDRSTSLFGGQTRAPREEKQPAEPQESAPEATPTPEASPTPTPTATQTPTPTPSAPTPTPTPAAPQPTP